MSLLDSPVTRTIAVNQRTLPFAWYSDPAILRREREEIFNKFWLYVGPTHRLAKAGDFLQIRMGGVPVLVARDRDGELHAMVNVCRHRGAEVKLEESGNCKALTCHYHAWTYGLDGSLLGVPRSSGEASFDKEQLGLRKLRLDTYGPFVFVTANDAIEPLSHYLGELPRIVSDTGVELDRLELRARKEYRLQANWKVVIENYLECYHCPNAHPSFADVIDLNSYDSEEYAFFSTQHGPPKEDAGPGAGKIREGRYNFLWPTFCLNIYPGGGNVSTNQIIPVDENNTVAVYEYFFEKDVDEGEAAGTSALIHQIMLEDIVLCESAHRGMASGYVSEGRLITRHEHSVSHFQDLVRASLAT